MIEAGDANHMARVLGARLALTMLVVAGVVVCQSIRSSAQSGIERISTSKGVLAVENGFKRDCGEYLDKCKMITLNGRILISEYMASIDAAYPSIDDPKLVSVSTATGGNGCCWDSYIIDFTGKSVVTVKNFNIKDAVMAENSILLDKELETNNLGDDVHGLFRYVLGTGKPRLLKKYTQYSMTTLSQKKVATDVMGDPNLRAPILKVVGADNFKEIRWDMGASPPLHVDERFIIGTGFRPHFAPQRAMFVIDRVRNVAWILQVVPSDNGPEYVKLWGLLNKDDTAQIAIISKWLKEEHLTWGAVRRVSLPNSVTNDFIASKQNENQPITERQPEGEGRVRIAGLSTENNSATLSPVDLFKAVSHAMFVIQSKRADGNGAQGSAVAVSNDTLLTNCHVVEGADEIFMKQGKEMLKVELLSANFKADRCILKSPAEVGAYVPIRPYSSLEVGERVYSIGAPLGLELTLADGLLSGKRLDGDNHLIQTSAPISPGSSGGGLSDAKGNLIGITTFMLKGSQNLNFAIAADDFAQK